MCRNRERAASSQGEGDPPLPVGFSAINFYVFALWPWNFLIANIYLFDDLEQILGVIASPRPKLQAQTKDKLLKNYITPVKSL